MAAKLNIFYAVRLAKFLIEPFVGHPSWDSIKHKAMPQELETAVVFCFSKITLLTRFSAIKRYTHPITQLRRL